MLETPPLPLRTPANHLDMQNLTFPLQARIQDCLAAPLAGAEKATILQLKEHTLTYWLSALALSTPYLSITSQNVA